MTLAPLWRFRFYTAGAAVVAIWAGWNLAQGDFFWPAVMAGALTLFLLARLQPFPLSAWLLAGAIAGYVIGNRGFAQITLVPNFPLLPAEAVLLVAGGLVLVQCAWRHELPFRRDALNLTLLLWMGVGCLRIGFDVRQFGFVALRDFALVYYAAFFFIGQDLAQDPRNRRLFEQVLLVACTLVAVVFPLYEHLPDFFFGLLVWRGNPLIFYKGDLVVTFMAIGAVLYFLRFEAGNRWRNAVVSLVLVAAVVLLNNRASLLALFVATAWLAVRGRWRFAAVQAGTGVVAAIVILLAASALRVSWERTPVFSVYERVISIADPTGQRTYRGDNTFFKGDNNLFRWVWWRNVVDETVSTNPYIGLGFGYDLADRFVREYYPESGEEFSTRSPHNVLLTIFGRMGGIGLAAFLVVIGIISRETWRALRSAPDTAGLWCAVWILLTSACLGVVLEGPMGAVVFWTMLGVAHAASASPAANAERENPADPALPSAATAP